MRQYLLCLVLCTLSLGVSVFTQPGPAAGALAFNFTTKAGPNNSTGYFFNVTGSASHFHVYGDCSKETTSHQAKDNACQLAMNGSPFIVVKPFSNHCLGDIVSDGSVLFKSTLTNNTNAFGLTPAGNWVFGDVPVANVTSTNFVQLLSGFHMLLIRGLVAPSVPLGGEIAPRTAVGTDQYGNLLLMQASGVEKDNEGLTLMQFALWAGSLGAYNLLNLDGGGSSTTFFNGKVVGCPTCIDYNICCERKVTSIMCIK